MKKLLLFSFLLLSIFAFSQAPEGINYQAVIRNSSGNLVSSTTVAIRVQVRQTTSSGIVIYQERHSVLTSAQGLINLVIGAGTPQVGTFNGINWGNGPYFVNLALDLANGVNYQDYGTQQLMSVPYALYAKTSGNQLNQWRYGNTAPPSTLGNFGDFYLDVITGNVYYKNSGTAWILTGNIKGPVGPTGLQGPAGPAGATGLTGSQGPQGVSGTNGTNGQNTLVKTTNESAGANCTTGGVKIEYGLDANSNGILDAVEINATITKYVCNGATGASGPQGPIGLIGPEGPQGIQGPAGATGTTGLTGPQGPQGVAGMIGSNGTNGQNTLVKTTTESAGANCTAGGVKIEYGLDANSNGILDIGEINATLTKYVCNGATGATGSQGVAGTNGTNGTNGLNALIKTTTEPSGSNCTNGGTKIETGLDANGNGVLDAGEVNASQTQFICNGSNGATNPYFANDSIFYSSHAMRFVNNNEVFIVPNFVYSIQIEMAGGGGGGGGQSGSACGGNGCGGYPGGSGAYIKTILSTLPGDTLLFIVGSGGSGGGNPCGNGSNGGPSQIFRNGVLVLSSGGGNGGARGWVFPFANGPGIGGTCTIANGISAIAYNGNNGSLGSGNSNSCGTPGSGWSIQGQSCSAGGSGACCGGAGSGVPGKIYILY
jgi:hypothetical protein